MIPENETERQKNYLAFIGGPILFTAPHSKKLIRGGKEYGKKQKEHLKQLHTDFLSVELAHLTKLPDNPQINSFCAWKKSNEIDDQDHDPNYLLESMFSTSPFHLILHAWAKKNENFPLLHIDIHGKSNHQNDCHIDIGTKAIRLQKEDNPILKEIQICFQEMNRVFDGIKFRGLPCVFDTTPSILQGAWTKGSMLTMSQQGVMLGISSFQMEIPAEVRKKLSKDKNLMEKFASRISHFYQHQLLPNYEDIRQPLKINLEYVKKFEQTVSQESQNKNCRSSFIKSEEEQDDSAQISD